jgi:hypothetical protein
MAMSSDRRMGGWSLGVTVGLLAVLSGYPPIRLSAQVGHDPATSPYRDIWSRQALSFRFGYLTGERGRFGHGPSGGRVVGLGYEIALGGTIQFHGGITHAAGTRFITDSITIDTAGSVIDTVSHRRGPFDMSVVTLDVQLGLALTGQKRWHGFAPYAAFGVGYTFRVSGELAEPDSTGFSFGTKFTLTPTIGTKVFLGRHLMARVEVRDHMWRLRYPLAYTAVRGGDLPLLTGGEADNEWTHHAVFTFAIGWTF